MSRPKASKNRRRTKKNRTRRNKKIGGTPPPGYTDEDMKYFKKYIGELPIKASKKYRLLVFLDNMPYDPDYVFNYTGKPKPMDTYGQGIDRIQSYNQSIN